MVCDRSKSRVAIVAGRSPRVADADQYGSLLIFNIRHNVYRLIVKVDYRARLVMVKEFLTHKEYERGGWQKWAR